MSEERTHVVEKIEFIFYFLLKMNKANQTYIINMSHISGDKDSSDYGFFCDLESNEEEEMEYYIVTKCARYEVRRKLKTRPIINGVCPNVIKLSEAKSSVDNLELYSPEIVKKTSIINLIMNLPRDLFYYVCVCVTTGSCVYLIMSQPDYKR